MNWRNTFYFSGEFILNTKLSYIEKIADGSFTPISDGFGSYERITASRDDLPLRSDESMLAY
jgi:hypothetical protein